MSDIPYVRELGERFEAAIRGAETKRPVRGPVVAGLSFVLVLLIAVGTTAAFGLLRNDDGIPAGAGTTVADLDPAASRLEQARIVEDERARIEAAEQARREAYDAYEQYQKEMEARSAVEEARIDAYEQYQKEMEARIGFVQARIDAAEQAWRDATAALEEARSAADEAGKEEIGALEQLRIAAEEARRDGIAALERARSVAEEARREEMAALEQARAAAAVLDRHAMITAATRRSLAREILAPLGLTEVSVTDYVIDGELLEDDLLTSEVKFNGTQDGARVAVTLIVVEGGDWSIADELESAGPGMSSTVDVGSATGALIRSGELTAVSWQGPRELIIQIVARGPISADSLLAYAVGVASVFESLAG